LATELTMPQMGYDMQEGTVVRWLKAEGSNVELGEPVAEIETDKAVVEFESYASGVLQKILVSEGSTVPVGEAIAVVGEMDAVLEEEPEPEVPEPVAQEVEEEEETIEAIPLGAASVPLTDGVVTPQPEEIPAEEPSETGRVFATPVARQLAYDSGIDLASVQGTGPGGRIVKEDVLRVIEAGTETAPEPVPMPEPVAEVEVPPEAEPVVEVEAEPEPVAEVEPEPEPELVPLSRMRQQIARVTIRSKSEKPHFYVNTDVDMTDAMLLRAQINQVMAADGVRATVNDLIIAASAIALRRFPKFNAYYEEGGLRMNDEVNVGIAMAVEDGLIMPAIVGAGDMSLREIAQASKEVAERAQQGTLSPQEYAGGTFAISNMGMMGVTSFVAIIQPPQSAVLAVGAVQKRPVVTDDDQITVRQMMTATLSADHRIVDGAEGAMFINEIKGLLENPLSIIL
jgi:pyruvate dehydrogenase E2 component (dihydrolipoamide acetyltransferase)